MQTRGAPYPADIRELRRAEGRLLAVLDDDPTGSQTVQGVQIVTSFEKEGYRAALLTEERMCFVLTNTRGLDASAASVLTRSVAEDLFAVAAELRAPIDIISRSDSTLRGHLWAETTAIEQARRKATGAGFDGVILAPAFFEAGRTTHEDVHWTAIDGREVPVGESEFARDQTFGYRSSDLKDFVVERSGGVVTRQDIVSLSLEDIRDGGVDGVRDRLLGVKRGTFIVVNATEYADYRMVAQAALAAEQQGRSFLFRTAPSFVRALAGLEESTPLRPEQIWRSEHRAGHGLVVVGSHVQRTTEQLAALRESSDAREIELDAEMLLGSGPEAVEQLASVTRTVTEALAIGDVIISTSRTVLTGTDADSSLRLSMRIAAAISSIVRAALEARPAWVIAKGGITSHDVAVNGLGIRRAEVVGQFGDGIVSLFRPVIAASAAVGMPFVVFPGNVGAPDMLARVVEILNEEP